MGVCFYLALVILHANCIFSALYYIVICGLSVSITFSYITSQTARFSEKCIEGKICVLIFSRTSV
jgi:hypothetical protein